MQAMCFYYRVMRIHFTPVKRRKALGYNEDNRRDHSGGHGVRGRKIAALACHKPSYCTPLK